MLRPLYKLLIFLACITVFRIYYIGQFDLTPDEAYYWTWGLHLDWCYYDQPGGIALADRLITAIFGATTWGLRMGAVVLGLIGTAIVYLTAKKLDFNETESAWSAALMHIIPLMASGHVLMLHDTVMLTAAIVMIYFIARAIFEEKRRWWIIAGVFAAMALYGKFSAIVLGVGVALFLLLSKARRFWFAKADPYLGALATVVLFFPVIAWNKNNEWIATLAVRKLAHQPDLSIVDRIVNIFDFFGSQAGLVSPIFFVMMVIAAWHAIRRINEPKYEKLAFLSSIFFGVLGYFLLQSLRAKVQGNWAALAYVPGAMLMVRHLSEKAANKSMKWIVWGKFGLYLAVLMTFIFILVPIVKIVPIPGNVNITDQVHGWEELCHRVDLELEKRPDLILAARRYQYASQLMFYCKGHPEVYVANWSSRGNQFDIWNDWAALQGRSVLYVDIQGESGKLWKHFENSLPLEDFVRMRGGTPIKTVHLTILENFKIEGPLQQYFEEPLKYSADKIRRRLKGGK